MTAISYPESIAPVHVQEACIEYNGLQYPYLMVQEQDDELVLPASPILNKKQDGKPELGLSVILHQLPSSAEVAVGHLIKRGVLSLNFSNRIPPAILQAIQEKEAHNNYLPMFLRSVRYQLAFKAEAENQLIQEWEGSIGTGNAAVSLDLDAAQTKALIQATDGVGATLELKSFFKYRKEIPPKKVVVKAAWVAVYDYLVSIITTDDGTISEGQLLECLAQMVAQEIITISTPEGLVAELSNEALFKIFRPQSSVVLSRETESEVPQYRLKEQRPHALFQLNYRTTVKSNQLLEFCVTNEVARWLKTELAGVPKEHYIYLLVDTAEGVMELPPRENRQLRSRKYATANTNLYTNGNVISSFEQAMLPSSKSVGIKPAIISPNASIQLGFRDWFRPLLLADPNKKQALPIITSGSKDVAFWPGRKNTNTAWYLEGLQLTPSTSNATNENSPFLFSFEKLGLTQNGKVGLRGRIQLTLQKFVRLSTQRAMKQYPKKNFKPVPWQNLTAWLNIPFVDADTAETKFHSFEGTIEEHDEQLSITFSCTNDWVRLAYGALAIPYSMSAQANLVLRYSFDGYSKTPKENLLLAFGGKDVSTPVLYGNTVARNNNPHFFNAAKKTMETLGRSVTYSIKAKPSKTSAIKLNTFALSKPRPLTAILKPNLVATNWKPQAIKPITGLFSKFDYVKKTFFREEKFPLEFPCSDFGPAYLDTSQGEQQVVGCQNALALGQISYKQYEELPALRDTSYAVYKSLQQANLFLVVPTNYVITRKASGEPDAYRPVIFINSLLSAEEPDSNSVELRASLQPDIPAYKLVALKGKLRTLSNAPQLRFPTDIPVASLDFQWQISNQIEAQSQVDPLLSQGPFLGVYFQMELNKWALIKSLLTEAGISGQLQLSLADGTVLRSGLLLHLSRVRGPWEEGPLKISSEGDFKIMTNNIEQTVEVIDLMPADGQPNTPLVPVEKTVIPGGEVTHRIAGRWIPVFHQRTEAIGELDEIRSVVEDIRTNIIFINLIQLVEKGIDRLLIKAKIDGLNQDYDFQLSEEMPVIDISVLLPLTKFVTGFTLSLDITIIYLQREAVVLKSIEWDMQEQGPVSVTSELLGLTPNN